MASKDIIRWFLVADSSRARVYAATAAGEVPVLVLSLEHPESREQGHDLRGNRGFRIQHREERNSQGHNPGELYAEEERKFAREIALRLHGAHARREFTELVLSAPPKLLGLLYEQLTKPVLASLMRVEHKNLVGARPEELVEVLSP